MNVLAASFVLWLISATCWGQADPPYVIGIGDLPGGWHDSEIYDMSADGRVLVGAGSSDCFPVLCEAIRWTAKDGIVGLGDLPGPPTFSQAFAVSADGQVIVGAGNIEYGDAARAFRFGNGIMEELPLPPGMTSAAAFDVSGDGSVIMVHGWLAYSQPRVSRTFRWTEKDGYIDIGGPPVGTVFGFQMSRDGNVIVGQVNFRGPVFRWTLDGGFQYVSPPIHGYAWSVSPDGKVIGGSLFAGQGERPFRWTEAGGLQMLSSPRVTSARLYAMSFDGSIMAGSGITWATIWESKIGLEYFEDILHTQGLPVDLENPFHVDRVTAISDDGRLFAGYGYMGDRKEGLLMRMPRRGDVNGNGLVDVCDLLQVIEAWGWTCGNAGGNTLCEADHAPPPLGDNHVDVSDLLMVIANWSP